MQAKLDISNYYKTQDLNDSFIHTYKFPQRKTLKTLPGLQAKAWSTQTGRSDNKLMSNTQSGISMPTASSNLAMGGYASALDTKQRKKKIKMRLFSSGGLRNTFY